MANAMVSSLFSYCNSLMYDIRKANTIKLQKVLKGLIQIVSAKFDHISENFNDEWVGGAACFFPRPVLQYYLERIYHTCTVDNTLFN